MKKQKYSTHFDARISINPRREVTIRDVSWEDMQKISENFGVEIDKSEGIAWIQFGNITFFQGDK